MSDVRFYALDGPPDPVLLERARARAPRHRAMRWTRSGLTVPPGARGRAPFAFSALDALGVLGPDGYRALALVPEGSREPDHLSQVFGPYFRFPFMARGDAQVGATRTEPGARGQGLATLALLEVADWLAVPGRRLWYLTEAANAASCRVAESAGMTLHGTGRRGARYGLNALGAFEMDESGRSAEGQEQST